MSQETPSNGSNYSLKAVIFDFDGTVIDSEYMDYIAWQEIASDMGTHIPIERFALGVGAADLFDPHSLLESQLHQSIRPSVHPQ